TFVVSAASLALLRVPARSVPREKSHFLTDLRDGWREVTSRRWLLAAICTFAVTNMASALFIILGPVVADASLGGPASWGLILTSGSIGGVVGGLAAIRIQPRRPLFTGFLVSCAMAGPLLALSVPLALPVIMVAAFLSWTTIQLSNTWWYTLLQQHIPEEARSRVSSYDWLVSLVFQPVGYMLAGPLSLAVGLTPALLGAGGLLIGANLAVLTVREVREVRWVEEPAP
ncbi:MAG TPA: MFS transporter, partial [Candidatus Limnocylindrales bacterium]